jgi:hypothetical protein
MFVIDSGGFPNNLLLFGFNIAKQISLFLHVLITETFWTSNGPKLSATLFFWEIEDREKNKSTGNATREEREGTI